uniref:Uncharacterized protein n=1 Tax=Lepeophtheirus salmonis TaxID=72036 RepID=A0A0K2V6V4_LEPSM
MIMNADNLFTITTWSSLNRWRMTCKLLKELYAENRWTTNIPLCLREEFDYWFEKI